MRRNSLRVAVGGTIAGAALGIASLSWACTAQLGFRVEPGGGVAGTPVAAEGDNATGPVEIRWNAADGPVLARANATSDGIYAVGFTVPDVAPGVYTAVALSRGNDGSLTKSESAFRVSPAPGSTGPSGQTVAADLWSGFGSADKAPAMVDGTVAASSGTDASQLRLGVGLLGTGLAALGAGFAVAEARRRKAAVAAQSVSSR